MFVEKNGPDPVRLFLGGVLFSTVAVPSIGEVQDTTGAGDAFAAGYLCALEQWSVPEVCVENGSWFAARLLSRS